MEAIITSMSSQCSPIIIRSKIRTICNNSVWKGCQWWTLHCRGESFYMTQKTAWATRADNTCMHKHCSVARIQLHQLWTASTSQTVGLITHNLRVHIHPHRRIKMQSMHMQRQHKFQHDIKMKLTCRKIIHKMRVCYYIKLTFSEPNVPMHTGGKRFHLPPSTHSRVSNPDRR